MWPKLIAKAKNGGLDVIQTYVFWNVHEPIQGQVFTLSSLICLSVKRALKIFSKRISITKICLNVPL